MYTSNQSRPQHSRSTTSIGPSSSASTSSGYIPRRPSPNKPTNASVQQGSLPPLGPSWRPAATPPVLYELPISTSRPSSFGASEILNSDPPDSNVQAKTTPRGRAVPPPPPSNQSYRARRQQSQSPSAASRLGAVRANSGDGNPSGGPSGIPMAQREGSLFSDGDVGRGGGTGAASTYSKRGHDGVSSPSPQDLNLFAYHCQLFYFSPKPPDASATYMARTLAALPPSHRATYTRLQSSLRAQSHDHATRLRLTHFHALISSTVPNASLSPLARGDLRGNRAKLERRERLGRFVAQWCLISGVGVEPFFKGLYNGLKLQGKGERAVGGAGGRTIVWEIDDAVFMEAGGKDFMNEAITVFKGVLGCEDVALSRPPKIRRPSIDPRPPSSNLLISSSPGMADTSVEQLIPLAGVPCSAPLLPARKPSLSQVDKSNVENGLSGNRIRAGSDPFTDPRRSPDKDNRVKSPLGGRGPAPAPPQTRSYHSPQPHHVSTAAVLHLSTGRSVWGSASPSEQGNPLSPSVESPLLSAPYNHLNRDVVAALEDVAAQVDAPAAHGRARADSDLASEPEDRRALLTKRSRDQLGMEAFEDIDEDEDLSAPRLRLWTFPSHISDPEIASLLALFPKHITTAAGTKSTRFPQPRPASLIGMKVPLDLEASETPPRMGESEWPFRSGIRVPPEGASAGFIRPGTGRMWVGEGIREPGWRGGFWYRLRRFFRKLFGV